MIFAFESKVNDWEQQFYDDEQSFDENGHRDEYQDRISNGFRLFGKYYENLWT